MKGAGKGPPRSGLKGTRCVAREVDREEGISIPECGRYTDLVRGRSSAVERQLPKLNVEGSIPFARFEEAARVAGAIRAVVFAKQARFIVGCGGITGAT